MQNVPLIDAVQPQGYVTLQDTNGNHHVYQFYLSLPPTNSVRPPNPNQASGPSGPHYSHPPPPIPLDPASKRPRVAVELHQQAPPAIGPSAAPPAVVPHLAVPPAVVPPLAVPPEGEGHNSNQSSAASSRVGAVAAAGGGDSSDSVAGGDNVSGSSVADAN